MRRIGIMKSKQWDHKEAEAAKKSAIRRVASTNAAASGVGSMVSKSVSYRVDPIGGKDKNKDDDTAIGRLLAFVKGTPSA